MTNVSQKVNQKVKDLTFSPITSEQCRGARAMLGWSQDELAKAAKVSRATVVDFERGARVPHPNNLAALHAAFEAGGIEFVAANGSGAGVRLKKSAS
jgi:transcriptional regulator with XRE-family HTH domain